MPKATIVEPDRGEAMDRAVREAGLADMVVVAGKGHETYQIIGDRTLAFDDRVVARAALDKRATSGQGANPC